MSSFTIVDNPNAPGAKMEMDRLRRENEDLKRQLGQGGQAPVTATRTASHAVTSVVRYTPTEAPSYAAAMTEDQATQQASLCGTFIINGGKDAGGITLVIKPLDGSFKMNPAFAGVRPHIGAAKVGKAKAKAKGAVEMPHYVQGETKEDRVERQQKLLADAKRDGDTSASRFALLEIDE